MRQFLANEARGLPSFSALSDGDDEIAHNKGFVSLVRAYSRAIIPQALGFSSLWLLNRLELLVKKRKL